MCDVRELQKLVEPTSSEPNIFTFCMTIMRQSAATKLENIALESMKLGGVQKKRLIATGMQEWAKITDGAGASDHVHPSLFQLLKGK
jgi:hypothetical protein